MSNVSIRTQNSDGFNLTSLGHALISEIISHLNPKSLQQLRLVNQSMKSIIDERITKFHYGNHFEDTDALQLEADFAHAYRLWPAIKEINILFFPEIGYFKKQDLSPANRAAVSLAATSWTDIEIVNAYDCNLGPEGGAALGLACARHWRRLRTLNVGNNFLGYSFFAELLKGEYPLLEELVLGGNSLDSCRLVSSAASVAPLAFLAARCPNLRILDLRNYYLGADGFVELAKGDFSALEVLDLYGNLAKAINTNHAAAAGAAVAKLISRCPKLKELRLGASYYLGAFLELILDCELPTLEVIDISLNGLDDSIAPAVAAAKWPRLRKLSIRLNTFTDQGLKTICQGNWPLLEEFDASFNEVDVVGALALRSAACGLTPRWSCLRSLNLDREFTKAEALQLLLDGDWGMLTHLSLEYNQLGVESANILAEASTRLAALKSLSIAGTVHEESEFQAFFSGNWSNLEHLKIGGDEVAPADGEAIAMGLVDNQFPALTRLECVHLNSEGVLDKGLVKRLFPQLEELTFDQCTLTHGMVTALAEAAKGLTNLRCLILGDNDVVGNYEFGEEEGVEMLLSAAWPKLERVMLRPFPVSRLSEGVRALGWRITGVDEKDHTVVERIDIESC